jgi:hypothetical protein
MSITYSMHTKFLLSTRASIALSPKNQMRDTSRTCDAVISRLIAPLGQGNRGIGLVSMLVSLNVPIPVKAAMYTWFQGFHGGFYG